VEGRGMMSEITGMASCAVDGTTVAPAASDCLRRSP
jgi:hypothetical protein